MASSSRPLKIALVAEATFAGVGAHVRDLSNALVERSHEVHLIWSPVRADGQFLDFAAASKPGLSLHEVAMTRSPGPSDMTAVRHARRLLRDLSPLHVVHGHSSKGGAVARLAAAGIAPSVATPHAMITNDPALSAFKKGMFGAAELALALLGNAIIAVSDEEAEHIRKLGVPRSRIRTIPNGIRPIGTTGRKPARARLELDDETPTVGFVGRLVPQKDPLLAVGAFRRLADESSRLVMIGTGELESEVRAAVGRHGLDTRVMLLGERPARDFIPALDVLIVSSRYEALPYVVLEAMSAGVPVVSTRTGAVERLLGTGAGLLVPCGDEKALSEAVRRLIEDREGARRAGEEGRRVAQAYSEDAMVDAIEALYRGLAGRPGTARAAAPAGQ